MKKVVKAKVTAELFLYAALVVMGVSIVFNPWIGIESPLFYIASIYIIFALFAFFAYFIGREDGDYELLLLSLVNVVMAVLLYYFKDGDLPLLLSFTLSAWSFFYITLKLIVAFQYKDKNPKKYAIKMVMTSIIFLLSSVTIFKMFTDDIMLGITTYGYYFIIIASLNFLEVTLNNIGFINDDSSSFKMIPSTLELVNEENETIKVLLDDIEDIEVTDEEKKPAKKKVASSSKKVTTSKAKTTTKSTTKKEVAKKTTEKVADKKEVSNKTASKKVAKKKTDTTKKKEEPVKKTTKSSKKTETKTIKVSSTPKKKSTSTKKKEPAKKASKK